MRDTRGRERARKDTVAKWCVSMWSFLCVLGEVRSADRTVMNDQQCGVKTLIIGCENRYRVRARVYVSTRAHTHFTMWPTPLICKRNMKCSGVCVCVCVRVM